MAKVHDLYFNTYVHKMDYPTSKFPLYDFGLTREIDPPFRLGLSRVFRIPFTRRAIVVGKWAAALPEDEALYGAIGARPLTESKYTGAEIDDV